MSKTEKQPLTPRQSGAPDSAENPKINKVRPVEGDADDIDAQKAQLDQVKAESFKHMRQYAYNEGCYLILGVIFLILASFSYLSTPYFIGAVIDLMQKGDFDAVGDLCVYMLIVIFVSGLAVGMRAAIFNIISHRIARNLRKDFFEAIIYKDIGFFDQNHTGDLVSRLNSDIQVVQDTLGTSFSMLARGFLFLTVTSVILCVISPTLTGVTFAGVIPLSLFSKIYSTWVRRLQRKLQTERAAMNNLAEESFANIRTVKSFANEKGESIKFARGSQVTYNAGVRKAFFQSLYSLLTQFLLYGAMAAVIYAASFLYKDGELTVGQLTAFLFYMQLLIFNFGMVANVLGNVASIFGASDKIVELIYHPVTTNQKGGEEIDGELDGHIELRNIKFSYPARPDVQVLNDVSLSVDSVNKRVVALCGTSGCGKSSIISLIERFYDPTGGEVLYNGVNIKDLDPKWYHNQVAIVQQEPVLFSGTIKENIVYGLDLEGFSAETIEAMMDESCRLSNAYDFIHDSDMFPLQYETLVGVRGVKLSVGQKQRIAIARALIRKPKVLLLDEATSALDAESEHQVQQALDQLIKTGKQTIVVVAHRLSTIRDANEIIVMEHGDVKERGTHDQLIELDGVYKNLVRRQMVAEEIERAKKEEELE